MLPGPQRVGHAQIVSGRLAHQGAGHPRVHPFLAVVHAGRGLFSQPGVPLGLFGRATPGRARTPAARCSSGSSNWREWIAAAEKPCSAVSSTSSHAPARYWASAR